MAIILESLLKMSFLQATLKTQVSFFLYLIRSKIQQNCIKKGIMRCYRFKCTFCDVFLVLMEYLDLIANNRLIPSQSYQLMNDKEDTDSTASTKFWFAPCTFPVVNHQKLFLKVITVRLVPYRIVTSNYSRFTTCIYTERTIPNGY